MLIKTRFKPAPCPIFKFIQLSDDQKETSGALSPARIACDTPIFAKLNPKCVVLVATIRALLHHGGVQKEAYNTPNLDAVSDGFKNLEKITFNDKFNNKIYPGVFPNVKEIVFGSNFNSQIVPGAFPKLEKIIFFMDSHFNQPIEKGTFRLLEEKEINFSSSYKSSYDIIYDENRKFIESKRKETTGGFRNRKT